MRSLGSFHNLLLLAALSAGTIPTATAGTPSEGTLTDTSGDLNYDAGPFNVPNQLAQAGVPFCTTAAPDLCDSFKLTVTLPANFRAQHPDATVGVTLSWVPAHGNIEAPGVATAPDYDLFLFEGDVPTTYGSSLIEPVGTQPLDSSASSANPEVLHFTAKGGTNVYTIKSVPFAPTGETIHVRVALEAGAAGASTGGGISGGGAAQPFGGPDAASPASPRFQVFAPTAADENNGQQNGEFNIGFNPKTGNIMAMAVTFPGKIYRLTPAEVAVPGAPESGDAVWADKSSLWGSVPQAVGDPILWTDQDTGRTFEANLIYGPNISYAYSDDDGETWTNAGISGIMGSDHETIATGPYPADPTAAPFEMIAETRGYVGPDGKGRAVYYCSQDNPAVWVTVLPEGVPGHYTQNNCVRSDDGGLTWSPVLIAATGADCGLQHGHLHVSNDGIAYLPNRHCTATQGGSYSADAGLTWNQFHVPGAIATRVGADPSIGIDANNTLYFCYVNEDGTAHVTVGHRNTDNSLSWGKDTDIGLSHGIVAANFVEAVGGDAGRAACGFIGTNAKGNSESLDFQGVWYAFIATTYDGGETWTTVNATPNDPVQGAGGIWLEGGGNINRNLLDFNEITIDDKGRVLYGYDDGCVTTECIADPTYSVPGHDSKELLAKMRVARQTGGRTLKAANDAEFASRRAPGRPSLSAKSTAKGVELKWKVPDHGGSPITGYTVARRPTGATGTARTFTTTAKTGMVDSENVSGSGYAYTVTATNAVGTSAASNVVEEFAPLESACTAPGMTVVVSPAGAGTGASTGLPTGQDDLRSVSFAEPSDQSNKLVVTMKMDNLNPAPPPGYRWITYMNVPGDSNQYWVGMSTAGENGATPVFQYGTREAIDAVATTAGSYTVLGTIDGSWTPDGTVQLVIDTSTAPFALKAGDVLTGIAGSIRRSSPDATNNVGLTVDSADGVNYTVVKNVCSGNGGKVYAPAQDSKGVLLGGGAFGLFTLLPLLGAGLLRRRKHS